MNLGMDQHTLSSNSIPNPSPLTCTSLVSNLHISQPQIWRSPKLSYFTIIKLIIQWFLLPPCMCHGNQLVYLCLIIVISDNFVCKIDILQLCISNMDLRNKRKQEIDVHLLCIKDCASCDQLLSFLIFVWLAFSLLKGT